MAYFFVVYFLSTVIVFLDVRFVSSVILSFLYIGILREDKDKRVNPPYKPYFQSKSSQVIFRHGTQPFRG